MLIIDNAAVAAVFEMPAVLDVLERAHHELAAGGVVCRPRIDLRFPTGEGDTVYQ